MINISKVLDLTGQKFGKLIALRRVKNPNKKKNTLCWECQCECGNISLVNTDSLTLGKTKQCWDCAHMSTNSYKRKDYTGETIGYLTILRMIYPDRKIDPKGKTKALCKCKCGNEVIKSIGNIISNERKGFISSCGCSRRESIINTFGKNITDQKFGRLTIKEILWNLEGYKKPMVKCLCDCGKEVLLCKNDVQTGHTQSCGCLQKEKASEAKKVDHSGYKTELGVEILYSSKKNKKNQTLWTCKCFCGNLFEILPAKIIEGHTQSCGCIRNSSGETFIENTLKENNISYKKEYTFPDCKKEYVLRFDFAIFDDNKNLLSLCEFDGQQHFKPIEIFGGKEGFKSTQERDRMKNKYCKEHSIPLVRFPYNLPRETIKKQLLNIIQS